MSFTYPLLDKAFSNQDLKEATKVLKSKKITMGKVTKKFEKIFSQKLKSKYCLMVNSGSSANLLAFFCIMNPKSVYSVKRNDECIVPALCWSTTLWPIIQSGLKPKFVDVNRENFCVDYQTIKKNITKKTKVIIIVNVLGNCSEIDKIRTLAIRKNIILIEDNCESLGSVYKKKHLGTFGNYGTFSFYYSHQITSGEGGMIICKSKNDYNILKALRAHGWDRELNKKNNQKFNFINQGFNLRPLDITAAIGLNQFRRLDSMKKTRAYNRNMIIKELKKSHNWNDDFEFFKSNQNLNPSWFGFPLIIKKDINKKNYLDYLKKNKVETRPIISGNFAKQPALKLNNIIVNSNKFKNAQFIEDKGFFIGLPIKKMPLIKIKKLSKILLNIKKF